MAIKNSIRQKTVVMNAEDGKKFNIGDEVILLELSNDNTGSVEYIVVPHNGKGIEGTESNKTFKYHGWRGSERRVSTFAFGVRKVTKVGEVYERSVKSYVNRQKVYKVTVGEDIHPDWE